MYLKSIKAQGFKSFADKTEILFFDNITGIVGPNGSGKSNVVDAIRWVLGEQSVKSLRGEGHMTDIIFSGSSNRNSANFASVTLVFDNSDRYLSLQFDEISIRRRLYKDGVNEYFINGEKVRLKDVSDLFLDSGMGKESFNIISQGKIEEILSSGANDKRIIFEEAAGVLKYKKRKEESFRKLNKTRDNIARINDIRSELDLQYGPLKEQSEKALEYEKISLELSNIEISLICNDITNLNFEYQKNKELVVSLSKEVTSISTGNSVASAKLLTFKNELSKVMDEIDVLNKNLLNVTSKMEQANGRKNIILERKKYLTDSKLHDSLVALKENDLRLKVELSDLTTKLNSIKSDIKLISEKVILEVTNLNKLKGFKSEVVNELSSVVKNINEVSIKIEFLNNAIDNNSSIPASVKNILNNVKLSGVCGVVSNLFTVNNKYSLAVTTALGGSISNLVVNNVDGGIECVNYLKANKLGRVTFLPLNVIKSRKLILDVDSEGFINLACNLISYEGMYNNIFENLLGNVLVVDNIENGKAIAIKFGNKYKIVTLEGDILNVGGSLTGGVFKSRNVITDKYELENFLKELEKLNDRKSILEDKGNEIDNSLKNQEDRIYILNKEKLEKEVILNSINSNINKVTEEISNNDFDLNSAGGIIDSKVDLEEQKVIDEYYAYLDSRNKISNEIDGLNKKKILLNEEIDEYEFSLKRENSLFNEKSEMLKQSEILINRLDVKLDNLLNSLSEKYSLTYEAAILKYKLEMEDSKARNIVSNLKRRINEMGSINSAAIEEFERISERLNFLNCQLLDLETATEMLLDIIQQMDEVMKSEFMKTFELIKENFSITFRELFKGGSADLILTDPLNILETGVEIVASPPGKKLKSISLLSGGEKTFTAISLLFAILKSKPVPFCILDEVEAALDDVNVDSFGNYVRNLKAKTQFIIVTHKKRTMEYVDVLYGITMQESGVSKLVSVKLDEGV